MKSLLPPEGSLKGEPETGRTFETVYSEYFPFVWRCLRSLGVPPEALEDAAQDVFLVVHRRLADFEGRSTMRTWLFGIVRNVASNRRRTMVRKGGEHSLLQEPASADPGPHEMAQDKQAADFIEKFLSGLDAKKRDLFVLAVLEEMSVPEVAEALSLPLNTAYTRLRRLRAEFRRALGEGDDMNEVRSSRESAILAGTRRILSPTDDEQGRVRLSVIRAADAASLAAAANASAGGMTAGASEGVAAAARWASRAAVLAAVVGASAGAGYWFGVRAGRGESVSSRLETAVLGPDSLPRPAPARPPVAGAVVPVEPKSTPVEVASRVGHAPHANVPARESPEDSLGQELRTLRRVERLLREGNPRLALSLLGELDRAVPGGRLVEERRAAATVARCVLEPGNATVRAAVFRESHPGSVYQKRVDRSCETQVAGPNEGKPR